MINFKVGKIDIGKRAAQLMLAFFIGWLCGCSVEQGVQDPKNLPIRTIWVDGATYEVWCFEGTEHYYGFRTVSPVIIDGVFQSCNK